ncbi:MAG: DUF4093 domain-containing protein [Mycoplasmatales bacterium]
MQQEIEREVKYLLDEQGYQTLLSNEKKINELFNLTKLTKFQDYTSIEHYYDNEKRSIKKLNAVLRIREQKEHITLTFKQKDSLNQALEKNITLSKIEQEKFLENYPNLITRFELKVNNLQEIATYKVKRKSLIYKTFRIDLDHCLFNNGQDYEIEIEDSSLEQAQLKIEILKKVFKLKLKPSKPKIARFFETIDQNNTIKLNIEDIIVVVEGKSDTNKLKQLYPKINTFETSGLGLTADKVQNLKKISQKNNKKVVVLTDPDVPGEIIRNIIKKEIPNAYHIHVPKDKAKGKKKVGIEHCQKQDLENIFNQVRIYHKTKDKLEYTIKDLINLGIYQNQEKRKEFCDKYSIAYGNNKKVLKQLNTYNIKL